MNSIFCQTQGGLIELFNNLNLVAYCVCDVDFKILCSNKYFKQIVHNSNLNNTDIFAYLEIDKTEFMGNLKTGRILSMYDVPIKPDCRKFKIVAAQIDQKIIIASELVNAEETDALSSFSSIANDTNNLLRELGKKNAQLEKANKKIAELTRKDDLTGVFNRRFLVEHLSQAMPLAKRKKLPLSLIMLDIDYFKRVNDNFGHDYGDIVLVRVSKIISESIRGENCFVRYGGEEFIIVLQYTQAIDARKVADRLRILIEKSDILKNLRITASFGITQMNANDSIETFIKRADLGLYESKKNGRNCCTVFNTE